MLKDTSLKILLVDDEPLARSRLRELLADIALQVPNEVVGEAGNGLVALELMRSLPVDVGTRLAEAGALVCREAADLAPTLAALRGARRKG